MGLSWPQGTSRYDGEFLFTLSCSPTVPQTKSIIIPVQIITPWSPWLTFNLNPWFLCELEPSKFPQSRSSPFRVSRNSWVQKRFIKFILRYSYTQDFLNFIINRQQGHKKAFSDWPLFSKNVFE